MIGACTRDYKAASLKTATKQVRAHPKCRHAAPMQALRDPGITLVKVGYDILCSCPMTIPLKQSCK